MQVHILFFLLIILADFVFEVEGQNHQNTEGAVNRHKNDKKLKGLLRRHKREHQGKKENT